LARDTAANLVLALAGGSYQPALPELVAAPGGDGRLLARYALPETILITALQRALAPRIDARLLPGCIGGRKGRSRFSFPPLLDEARARGLHWALVTDVADFYASIAPARLDAVLAAPPFRLAVDVRRLCLRLACGDGARGLLIGHALGAPLANAFLHACDERLAAAAALFCRYMDDIVVFAGSRSAAERELRGLESWLLSERGLRLSGPKTGVCHRTREGFEFLGLRVIGASVLPSPRNVERFEGQVRDGLARGGRRSAAKTLRGLNRRIHCFGHACKRGKVLLVFTRLDEAIRRELRSWLKSRPDAAPASARFRDPARFPGNLAHANAELAALGLASLVAIKRAFDGRRPRPAPPRPRMAPRIAEVRREGGLLHVSLEAA
jgi:hypothetical protein